MQAFKFPSSSWIFFITFYFFFSVSDESDMNKNWKADGKRTKNTISKGLYKCYHIYWKFWHTKNFCLHFRVIIFVHCTHFTTLHLLILRHWKMPKHTLFTALGTGRLSLTSWVQGCLEDASSIKFLTKLVLGFSQYDQAIA